MKGSMKPKTGSLVGRTAAGPDQQVLLQVRCSECADAINAPLPIDRSTISDLIDAHQWFLSVMTPPEQIGVHSEAPIVLGPLCSHCAPLCLPPEVFQAAVEARASRWRGKGKS
jgi:hypothetical protein